MDDLNRSGSISYRAVRQSSPGVWSWLGLLLLTAALLLSIQFRGSVVEQMEYREWDSASVSALNDVILGLSIALAVAGAIAAWRVWWTFCLIGTTALGIPDVTATGMASLRAAQDRGWSSVSRLMGVVIARFFEFAGRSLAYVAQGFSLVVSTPFVCAVQGTAHLFRFVFAGTTRLWATLSILAGPAVAGFFHLVRRLLSNSAKGSRLVASLPFVFLAKWTVQLSRVVFTGASKSWTMVSIPLGAAIGTFFLIARRSLAFVAIGSWLVVSIPFVFCGIRAVHLCRVVSIGTSRLWAAVSRPMGAAIVGFIRVAGRSMAISAKGSWLVISIPFAALSKVNTYWFKAVTTSAHRFPAAVSGPMGAAIVNFSRLAGRFLAIASKGSWLVVSTTFVCLRKGTAILFKIVATSASRLWMALRRGWSVVNRPLSAAISGSFRFGGSLLSAAAKGSLLVVSIPSMFLGKGTANLSRVVSKPFPPLGRC